MPARLPGSSLLPVTLVAIAACFSFSCVLVVATLEITARLPELPDSGTVPVYVTPREWCGILLLVVPQLPGPRLQVVAMSIGQGDSTQLFFSSSRYYLIDHGNLAGSTIDIGDRLLAGVILTHNHPDHSAGLAHIIDRFKVDGFWSAIPPAEFDPRLAVALQRHWIAIYRLDEGWTRLSLRQAATLQLYVPRQDAEDLNDRSIFVLPRLARRGCCSPATLRSPALPNCVPLDAIPTARHTRPALPPARNATSHCIAPIGRAR